MGSIEGGNQARVDVVLGLPRVIRRRVARPAHAVLAATPPAPTPREQRLDLVLIRVGIDWAWPRLSWVRVRVRVEVRIKSTGPGLSSPGKAPALGEREGARLLRGVNRFRSSSG